MINQGTTQKMVAVKVFIEPLANDFFGGDCTTRCFLDCPRFFVGKFSLVFSGMKSISSPRRSPSQGQVASYGGKQGGRRVGTWRIPVDVSG